MRKSTAIHNLGYSPQSAVNRVIKDGSQFDSLFPKPDGKKILLKKDGEVDETVQFMKQIVNDCNYQTKKIAEKIAVRKNDGSLDEKASVQSLWNFVVDYIKYNIEAGEQLRTPAKTWYDAQVCARQHPGVNDPQHSADCDCMSIFCGCVLLNWGIPFSFRITGYSDVLGICHGYQHVYTIAHCKGENVICDPVYHLFNAEKPFEIQKTYAMSLNGCDIYALSGIPDEDEELGVTEYYETPDGSLGVLGGKAKRKAKKAKRKEKKAKRKAAKKEKKAAKKEIKAAKKEIRKARKSGDKAALAAAKEKKAAAKAKKFNAKETIRENRVGIAKVASKIGQGIKKGTMALPRAAFLILLRLNFRGMARKFSNNQTAYNKFAEKWKRVFGGKEKKLKKAIEKGKKKKAFFGKGKNVNGLENDLYELGAVLGRYGMISKEYISALAERDRELNPGLGIEPVTMSIGAAITSALPIIQQCLDIFSSVKDLIPSNAQEAEEEGMASQEVNDEKYVAEDPDNMEDDEEESEEEMEGFPLRGIEDGYYFIGDVAINGIPRTVICKKDECGNISVLGALNGKKKEARKAKKAAKKAAKKEKKAAKKAAKAEKKAAKKAAKAAKKEAKKEKKAAKKAAKAEKKAAKKEMKKAKKEAKKEAKKLGLSKKEAKKYVKEKKKEAKKEYKAKKKEIKATKKAAVKEAKAKKKEAKKAVKAAKKDYKAAKKDIKKTYKAAKKEAKQAFKQAKKDIKQQKKAAKAEKKAAKKAAKQQTTYDVDEPIKDYENNEVEVLDDDMNVVDTDMDNTVDSGVDNAEFDENFDNAENDISIEPNEDGEDFSDGSDDFADGGAENDSESGEDGDEDFFDSPEDAAAASGKKNKKRTASADSEDGEDSDGEDEETAEEKKKSSKKKLIIGGVVLAALGGLGFWLYKRKKQQPTASNTKSLKA